MTVPATVEAAGPTADPAAGLLDRTLECNDDTGVAEQALDVGVGGAEPLDADIDPARQLY